MTFYKPWAVWKEKAPNFRFSKWGEPICEDCRYESPEMDYLETEDWAISKSSKSAVVSRTHLNAPQQQLKFLQLDFSEALTTRPKNAKNAPERVNQNGELNSEYQLMSFYLWVANLISAP